MSPQSASRRGVPKLIFSSLNDFPSKLSLVRTLPLLELKKKKNQSWSAWLRMACLPLSLWGDSPEAHGKVGTRGRSSPMPVFPKDWDGARPSLASRHSREARRSWSELTRGPDYSFKPPKHESPTDPSWDFDVIPEPDLSRKEALPRRLVGGTRRAG